MYPRDIMKIWLAHDALNVRRDCSTISGPLATVVVVVVSEARPSTICLPLCVWVCVYEGMCITGL